MEKNTYLILVLKNIEKNADLISVLKNIEKNADLILFLKKIEENCRSKILRKDSTLDLGMFIN